MNPHDLLLQSIEEAGEYIKAGIKYERASGRIDSPTPCTVDEALTNLVEEHRDMVLMWILLGFGVNEFLECANSPKVKRMLDRLKGQRGLLRSRNDG